MMSHVSGLENVGRRSSPGHRIRNSPVCNAIADPTSSARQVDDGNIREAHEGTNFPMCLLLVP
jgi:hypothetical protein